jgi:multiple antibiotic resistance protein
MNDYSAHLQFIVGLFAMMDPIATIPIMLGLTVGFTGRQYRQVAMAATLAVMIILVGAQYSGIWLLDLLGTSLGSLEIAGGMVIAFSGFSMLSASGLESNPMFGGDEGAPPWQMGIVPLAIPLLAGPGAITKVLLESQDAHGVSDTFHVTLVIVGVCLAVGVVLMMGQLVGKLIGKVGTIIFNRLFGLIVIAIGVEILISGIAKHMAELAN